VSCGRLLGVNLKKMRTHIIMLNHIKGGGGGGVTFADAYCLAYYIMQCCQSVLKLQCFFNAEEIIVVDSRLYQEYTIV